jgi:hypothetical protein
MQGIQIAGVSHFRGKYRSQTQAARRRSGYSSLYFGRNRSKSRRWMRVVSGHM